MLFDIGEQIPESRKMRHVSLAEVAHALGMGRTNIGQIENGTLQENGDAKTDSYSGVFELGASCAICRKTNDIG